MSDALQVLLAFPDMRQVLQQHLSADFFARIFVLPDELLDFDMVAFLVTLYTTDN